MKISFLERLLLAVTGILGAFFAVALGAIAYFGDKFKLSVGNYALSLKAGPWPVAAIGLIALIVLIWALKLLALSLKREPRQDRGSVSVQHTENGSVRISVAAMDTLVKQAIAHDEGVVDIKTAIVNHEDSISVNIDMTLASDVHIPNVTMMMQRAIKNFIEEFSGIAVHEVTIMVSKIIEVAATAAGAAREGRIRRPGGRFKGRQALFRISRKRKPNLNPSRRPNRSRNRYPSTSRRPNRSRNRYPVRAGARPVPTGARARVRTGARARVRAGTGAQYEPAPEYQPASEGDRQPEPPFAASGDFAAQGGAADDAKADSEDAARRRTSGNGTGG